LEFHCIRFGPGGCIDQRHGLLQAAIVIYAGFRDNEAQAAVTDYAASNSNAIHSGPHACA